jgi:oligopeptidase A
VSARADKSEANPLLDPAALPRFDAIRAEHVEPAIDAVLAENRAAIEALAHSSEAPTWGSFAAVLEETGDRLDRVWSPVRHLNAVMDQPALRDAYNACVVKLSAYATEVGQDERLYRGYRAIAEGPQIEALDAAQRRVVSNALRDFRLAGVALEPDAKARFKAIQEELSTLSSRFEQNLLDATDAWSLQVDDDEQLAGLPASAVDLARDNAREAGTDGWRFNLEAPSYIPLMTYADDRALRRQAYEAYVTRASELGPHAGRWDNTPNIDRILELRAEAARLVGYPHFAEYALETRMARSTQEVVDFLRDLAAHARPAAEREWMQLQEFARNEHGLDALQAWDVMYYAEKLKQHRYSFNREDVRPYFPVERVLTGMFEVVRRLFGIDVRPAEGVALWHPDVRFMEIRDAKGELRGQFYLDLYARPHKRGGAWMDSCRSRKRNGGSMQTPVAYLTCNFPRPVSGKPSLLSHEDVVTLFHEFGHGLHHMLTCIDYAAVSGINGVAWDAVELPSQFLENWCWEEEALAFISGHYQTGEVLPSELLNKMKAAKNFQSGMATVRQIEFALFDIRLHSDFVPGAGRSVQSLIDEVRKEVAVVRPPEFNRFQNGFAHIFAGGYAAGYYSYKWAEVLSADAYGRFEEAGVFDREAGRDFLHAVLEQGGSRDPMELFVEFRGREPQIDALLRHSGLAA